jgi:hypothetical protein
MSFWYFISIGGSGANTLTFELECDGVNDDGIFTKLSEVSDFCATHISVPESTDVA